MGWVLMILILEIFDEVFWLVFFFDVLIKRILIDVLKEKID